MTIEIIIGALVVISFVKVMWDISKLKGEVKTKNNTYILPEGVKLVNTSIDKMVADIPTPKKKVTKKAVKRVKKNESK